jgi:hypothetical protein
VRCEEKKRDEGRRNGFDPHAAETTCLAGAVRFTEEWTKIKLPEFVDVDRFSWDYKI